MKKKKTERVIEKDMPVGLSKAYQCRGQIYLPGSYGYQKKKTTLHKACWDLVSEIVRKSGVEKYGIAKCYTCGRPWHWKDMDCGHFEHAGTSHLSLLDFYFDNLRHQCRHCNKHLKGNLAVYGKNLLEEIGEERFHKIMQVKREINRMMHEDYEELKKKLKERLKKLNEDYHDRLSC